MKQTKFKIEHKRKNVDTNLRKKIAIRIDIK